MSALAALLAQVKAHGGTVEARGDRLRLTAPEPLPPGLVETLRERKGEILALLREPTGSSAGEEVRRRAAIFRAQVSEPGPIPFFHLPEARGREVREGECLSCAGPLPEGSRWRCPLCLAAAQIALRAGDSP